MGSGQGEGKSDKKRRRRELTSEGQLIAAELIMPTMRNVGEALAGQARGRIHPQDRRIASVTGGTGRLGCRSGAKALTSVGTPGRPVLFRAKRTGVSDVASPASGGGPVGIMGKMTMPGQPRHGGVSFSSSSLRLCAFALFFSSLFPSPALAGYSPETEELQTNGFFFLTGVWLCSSFLLRTKDIRGEVIF